MCVCVCVCVQCAHARACKWVCIVSVCGGQRKPLVTQSSPTAVGPRAVTPAGLPRKGIATTAESLRLHPMLNLKAIITEL